MSIKNDNTWAEMAKRRWEQAQNCNCDLCKELKEIYEQEFAVLLQLQSELREIEKLSFGDSVQAKKELLTRYSIKKIN